jgi:hypothetical protein
MKTFAILVIVSTSWFSVPSVQAINEAGRLDEPPREYGPRAPHSISFATYDGHILDLRRGWGTAMACHVDAAAKTRCFATEAEMDAFIDAGEPTKGAAIRSSARAFCGSTLRLYDAISYGVPVLSLNLRGAYIDLATLGFDNATTSYKVGACSSTFWDGVGGGAVYAGNTSANAQSPNMVTGWNNVISSVYIY